MDTGLQQLGRIDFSNFLDDPGANWHCFLSPSSPLERREKGRNTYASWLRSDRAGRKGLYIWLHGSPDSRRFRFIHVGLSKDGDSTIASRTIKHCQHAFSCDPTYQLRDHDNGFGCLEKVRPCDERGINLDYAERFLRQIRVLLLIPPEPVPKDIARMEGLIAHAAALAFGAGQITNTIGHVQRQQESDNFSLLAQRLNEVVPMLPEVNQNSSRNAL